MEKVLERALAREWLDPVTHQVIAESDKIGLDSRHWRDCVHSRMNGSFQMCLRACCESYRSISTDRRNSLGRDLPNQERTIMWNYVLLWVYLLANSYI